MTDFYNLLPKQRLGKEHLSFESFQDAVKSSIITKVEKVCTLILITHHSKKRILLGLKRRGFGTGFYNGFGGKVEDSIDASIAHSAVRELKEETNLQTLNPVQDMEKGYIGVLRFTFEDQNNFMMVVHLFRLDLEFCTFMNLGDVQGCDEITPEWFQCWSDLPFHRMHADDSIPGTIHLNGWCHFKPGGPDVNTISHHHFQTKSTQSIVEPKPISLERRLFHRLHIYKSHLPIKEFKESWAFANAVVNFFGKSSYDLILDVAGGHGALAMLLLILSDAMKAVVIDPAPVRSRNGIADVWKEFLDDNKVLHYRQESLSTGLPEEIKTYLAAKSLSKAPRVLVVACHDETMQIAASYNCQIATLPCCQKDLSHRWKPFAKALNISVGSVIDILSAGKMMQVGYDVKIKLIDLKITPQNRLILCRHNEREKKFQELKLENSTRLDRAYEKAHKKLIASNERYSREKNQGRFLFGIGIASISFIAGIIFSRSMLKNK